MDILYLLNLNEGYEFKNLTDRNISDYRLTKIKNISNLVKKNEGVNADKFLLTCVRNYYDDESIAKLVINYSENSKPSIEGYALEFSLSHSNGYYACVLSSKKVGLDIEMIRENSFKLSSKLFNQEQLSCFNNLDDEFKKKLMFFQCWVVKEAFFKIEGVGTLIGSLSKTNVDLEKYQINNQIPFIIGYYYDCVYALTLKSINKIIELN